MRSHRRSSWRRPPSAARSFVMGLAAAAAGLSLLLIPATAAAEVAEGRATDPIGDSLGAPSQDIVSARVQYEPTGQLTVSATMNGEVAAGPRTFFRFAVGSYAPPAARAGGTVACSGYATGKGAKMTITGVKGTGTALRFVFGKTISFTSFD